MIISGNMDNDSLNENFSTLLMGKSPGKRGSSNFMEVEESTMYENYPPRKPFINDPYERPPYKPVSTYPEGNRTAVVDALRNLQHKIHALELERTTAEDKLKSLARETSKYQDTLQRESEQRKPSQTSVSKHNQELESQLSVAETRCQLLEKQLENMRNMVSNAEKVKISAISKTIELDRLQEPVEHSSSFQENLRKIAELERDHMKLTANRNPCRGNKIRELEERLGEERHHRKVIVEKAAEIESVQKANRILQEADEKEREFKKPHKVKRATKKKKKVVSKKSGHCHKTDPAKHYRLNLNDIPFVAGKNTGPSYSVGANVQNVLSLMKSHNMALCSRATYAGGSCGSSTPSSSESSSPSTEHDLAEILIQLQDEFHQMSFEHQELSKEISDSEDPRMREDMERELEALVSRMEAKSLQISKIRGHQEKVANKKKKKSRRNSDGDEYSTPRSGHRYAHPRVSASPSPVYSGEVEVTTTIKPRGAGAGVVQIRPSSAREISLNVLKDMKKLQSTLRKDDLCWK
ncbi:centrosomal protein of 57 kDa-like [Dreissena polymorpha]|uniref:centrosomal protein of 57 kDa-like n=1 Tax=Dreissena polymorpha TaxID=45954 RepID=UPI0022646970|nr:centrosomal protein of 57 kDa-like [Dreissena polymorpha]